MKWMIIIIGVVGMVLGVRSCQSSQMDMLESSYAHEVSEARSASEIGEILNKSRSFFFKNRRLPRVGEIAIPKVSGAWKYRFENDVWIVENEKECKWTAYHFYTHDLSVKFKCFKNHTGVGLGTCVETVDNRYTPLGCAAEEVFDPYVDDALRLMMKSRRVVQQAKSNKEDAKVIKEVVEGIFRQIEAFKKENPGEMVRDWDVTPVDPLGIVQSENGSDQFLEYNLGNCRLVRFNLGSWSPSSKYDKPRCWVNMEFEPFEGVQNLWCKKTLSYSSFEDYSGCE